MTAFVTSKPRLLFTRRKAVIGLFLYSLLLPGLALTQDLEPRRWTPLPVGMNVFGAGFVHTEGDISFDPVLRIEDATVKANSVVLSFLRAFDLLGNSARVDFRVPYKRARWKGLLEGEPASAEREGFGDPLLRLSVNFIGAPALAGEEFLSYRRSHPVNTVVGAALAVTLPLGEYKRDKLLNLGENRYVFRPQLGVVHARGPWSFELTGSAFLYSDNDEFVGDNKREQDPLLAVQSHIVYAPNPGWWVSIGAAHDWGGESKINGEEKDDRKRDVLYGIGSGVAIGSRSSLKLTLIRSRKREDIGSDTDIVALSCSIRF